jgi:hypothetical protein
LNIWLSQAAVEVVTDMLLVAVALEDTVQT